MRKLFILLLTTVLLHSAFAQTPKNDLGENGLKGRVRSVNAQSAKISADGQSLEGQQLSYNESYDEQGNLAERTSFDYRGNIRDKSAYKIVDGDKATSIEYFHHEYDPPPPMAPPSSGEAKPRDPRYNMKFKYKYEGNKVERIIYYNDGTQGNRNISTYDEKGNLIRWELYTSEGQLNFSRTSVFNKQGVESETTYYHGDGSISSAYKYTDYEIDLRGNWIKRKSWQSKGDKTNFQPYRIESRTITYFDDAASAAITGSAQPVANRPKVIRLSEGALADRATRKVMPSFPSGARAGKVLVEITVDEQGNVAAAEGVSGDSTLIEVAVAAARQWRFKPTKLSGEPVKVIGRITFRFSL